MPKYGNLIAGASTLAAASVSWRDLLLGCKQRCRTLFLLQWSYRLANCSSEVPATAPHYSWYSYMKHVSELGNFLESKHFRTLFHFRLKLSFLFIDVSLYLEFPNLYRVFYRYLLYLSTKYQSWVAVGGRRSNIQVREWQRQESVPARALTVDASDTGTLRADFSTKSSGSLLRLRPSAS